MLSPTGNGNSLSTILLLPLLLGVSRIPGSRCLEVIYAINAGGESHTDSYGIHYAKDPLMNKVGTASDYGKQLIIGRVNNVDQILYQTERYHHNTFGYDVPISQDDDYVMILKFCEVYFNSPNMKVNILSAKPLKKIIVSIKLIMYNLLIGLRCCAEWRSYCGH